jgi:hypothetical protein
MGQRGALGTVPVFIAQVPPGPGQLTILPVSGTVTVGVGTNTPLTSTNGVLVPSGGLSVQLFSGGGPSQLYAVGGTPSVLSFIISTSTGQTGF